MATKRESKTPEQKKAEAKAKREAKKLGLGLKTAVAPAPTPEEFERPEGSALATMVVDEPLSEVLSDEGEREAIENEPELETPKVEVLLATIEVAGGLSVRVRHDPNGVIWCECKPWVFSKTSPKTCEHLANLADEGMVPAQFRELYVVPSRPVAAPVEASVANATVVKLEGPKRTPVADPISLAFKAFRKAGLVAAQGVGRTPEDGAFELVTWAESKKVIPPGVVFYTKPSLKNVMTSQPFELHFRPVPTASSPATLELVKQILSSVGAKILSEKDSETLLVGV